jgi:2-keto-3-deoxy-L-rhamnonate aldolase RhmA
MLRKRLNDGATLLGSWLQLPDPLAARILAAQGFDWLALDCEHGPVDLSDIPSIFAQIHAHGVGAMARLPAVDSIWIRRVLDCGADGIIAPMVNNVALARDLVRHAKYPPLGERGFGFALANEYGQTFPAYAAEANDDLLVIAQIEHIEAVKCIDDILAVEGIDGVIIGPYDLSGSMDLVGQVGHPEVQAAASRVLQACQAAGKAAGYHVVSTDPEAAGPFLEQGYRFVALGMDTLFLRDGAAGVLNRAREI